MYRVGRATFLLGTAVMLVAATGCGLSQQIQSLIQAGEQAASQLLQQAQQTLEQQIGQNVTRSDPRTASQPAGAEELGVDVLLGEDVKYITDITEDLSEDELDEIILLAWVNETGYDIYIAYTTDGEPQEVFVPDGEAVLLAYPCFTELAIWKETDFDPLDGSFVQEWPFDDLTAVDPDNFECGDLFVITITPDEVFGSAESVDLLTGALEGEVDF